MEMTAAPSPRQVYTIGHSTRTVDEFVASLEEVGVRCIVDVRSIPRSRAMPQFNREVLPGTLAAAGIAYSHLAALGGRRHHPKASPPSLNTYWRVAAFRNYADYAETAPFRDGLAALRLLATSERCAIMCAEAVWWRCHRRIIADYLLTEGFDVQHILGPGKISSAILTPGVRQIAEDTLRYDGEPIGGADSTASR
jgi:uncharacterized protein (DUF488 family)